MSSSPPQEIKTPAFLQLLGYWHLPVHVLHAWTCVIVLPLAGGLGTSKGDPILASGGCQSRTHK